MDNFKRTITKRTDSVFDQLEVEFSSLCDIDDFKNKLNAVKKTANKSDRPSKLRQLFDLFDKCDIAYEYGKTDDYYEKLILDSNIPSFSDIEDRMLVALFKLYKEYPSPKDYMMRIVDRLSCDDEWKNDTLRLRILKQFIKYGNYLCDAGFSGKQVICEYVRNKIGHKPNCEEVLKNIDDEIFNGLETAGKEQKKAEGKFGLIKISDDLAEGKFHAEGATKKNLYLFAMVYGMTYYSGDSENGEIIDFKTDIEINLFRDYYANNLMRFITEPYKNNRSAYEIDPSGQGINYKNFAEVIYLYYISKDCTAEEKIKLSSEMIKRVQTNQRSNLLSFSNPKQNTIYYQGLFKKNILCGNETILNKADNEFEDFICQNYNCNTFSENHSVGAFQLETTQNTAFCVYESILNDLRELDVPLDNYNYGLWFTDVAAFYKKGHDNICNRRKDIACEEFDDFLKLLVSINNFIGYTVNEQPSERNSKQEWTETSKMKTKALYVSSPKAVTRTSILVAFYYYYNAIHENDKIEKRKSFEELFYNFKNEVDPKLEAAYYQPLCSKNIFDVFLVFSSYAYTNLL